MGDFTTLSILIIILIGYLLIYKEKFKNWNTRDSISKSFAIKFLLIAFLGIILMILKIINSH